jgi:hypothetical protein
MQVHICKDSNQLNVKAETNNEKDYLKTVLDRLIFTFQPTITIWSNGVRIEGKAKQVGNKEVD